MNIEAIKSAVTSKAATQIFRVKRNSPTILFAAGAVGFGATIVLAVRATSKVSEKVDRASAAKVAAEKPHRKYRLDATPEEIERDVRNIKLTLAGDVAKTYALPITVGLVTLSCFGGAHYILQKRNAGLLVAYGALHRAHSEYRKRVVREVGEDRERELYLDVETRMVEEKLANGDVSISTAKGVNSDHLNGRSPYAALYDEKSRFFTREPGMNASILEIKRGQANDKLMANGHMFLNEVYDILGLPRTGQGAIVGWIYDPRGDRRDADSVARDSFITFGMWENDPEFVEDLIDGRSKMGVWLDFNVDGPIWDKI